MLLLLFVVVVVVVVVAYASSKLCEFILHDVPKVNLSDVHCNSWMAWDLMGIRSNWSQSILQRATCNIHMPFHVSLFLRI